MIKRLKSDSSSVTEKIAEKIGKRLRGGEVVELISDLGGGKTTFVRGLARGAGSADVVGSPTFTLSKVYRSKNFVISHFDFYRANDAGILEHEISELAGDGNSVLVIEWAEAVKHVLPEGRLSIKFKPLSEQGRELTLDYPEKLAYLVEDL